MINRERGRCKKNSAAELQGDPHRCLGQNPDIAYGLLDVHGLLGGD